MKEDEEGKPRSVTGWRNRSASEQQRFTQILEQALKPTRRGREHKGGDHSATADRVIAALLENSPDREALFKSPEFRKAVAEIVAHDGAAEAIARLCNALSPFSREVAQRQTLSFRIIPVLRRIGLAINTETESLAAQVEELRKRGHKEEARKLLELVREVWALNISWAQGAGRLEEMFAHPGLTIPGLDGSAVGRKSGVTAKAAIPAAAAREVKEALPPSLRNRYKLMATLLQLAGIPTTKEAVKSAVQAGISSR